MTTQVDTSAPQHTSNDATSNSVLANDAHTDESDVNGGVSVDMTTKESQSNTVDASTATAENQTLAERQSPTTDPADPAALTSEAVDVEQEQADSLRRKRDREGSLEPSLTPSKQETIPAKKNRLQSHIVAEVPSTTPSSPPLKQTSNVEGEKVGQIRKRVEDLSWKQRKEGDRDSGIDENANDEKARARAGDERVEDDEKSEKPETRDATALNGDTESPRAPKRTQPTFSSFSSSSGFGASASGIAAGSIFAQKSAKDSEPDLEASSKSTPPPLPARTQPTFSSFSKSSSPFGSASASVAGPSWLAGKASGSSTGGGIKPSTLGSMPGSSHEHNARSTPPLPSQTSSPPPSSQATAAGKGLGFGAFAASNPFSSGKAASRSNTPSASSDKAQNREEGSGGGSNSDAEKSGRSFDEALREGGVATEEKKKVETQLDKGQADLRTGEEDEMTVASIRAKLFTMAEDKSWKERGTGMVRCNVPKQRGGQGHSEADIGARLVMRSEGVLRLILNVKLFKGMKVELEQDKFLRLVAFEDGKLNHFAIRMGNATAASQFYHAIQRHIPVNGESLAAGNEEVA